MGLVLAVSSIPDPCAAETGDVQGCSSFIRVLGMREVTAPEPAKDIMVLAPDRLPL
jgi:hypothetical protein